MKFFDDDMDELFNKAGRQYPLKTEPKNWEAVRGALLQEQGVTGATQKNRSWRRLLPLLLLLLIPAVYVFIDKGNVNKDNVDNSSITIADKKAIRENTTSADRKESVKPPTPPVTKQYTESTNSVSDNKVSDREVNQLSYVPPSKQTLNNVTKVGEKSVDVKGGLSGPPQAGILEVKPDHFVQLTPATDINNEPMAWNNFPSLNNRLTGMKEPSEMISLGTPVRSLDQTNESQSVPNFDKKDKNKINRKGLYYGLIGGADLSTIKGQEVKGIGYSTGVIVGYTINNHWQLEGGALWSRKKYYTDGKYFSKEGARIPANINLHWLDGGCEMFEFPLVVTYNLSERKNTFFASAGLTSYMMREEDYKYSAQAGASGYNYEGYRSYRRSGDHLFANLQLSAGYKLSLSSKFNIRFEPYLKTPLKKIGIGKMPITSTGLNFAITRDFR
jgi:hypothetical protein